jgi:hypothetical protein
MLIYFQQQRNGLAMALKVSTDVASILQLGEECCHDR